MKIKICGISNTEILQYACEMGADFTGFIMADKSPRKISKDFLASLKNFDFQKTTPVFVFVNPTIDEVMKIVTSIPKSILQFHGDESNEFCKQFNQPFWKAIRVENSKSLVQIQDFSSAEALLLETHSIDSYGGTGKVFDWSLLKKIELDKQFILAGGINLQNLSEAISLKPWCIDLNSGVESSLALKDINLIDQAITMFKDGQLN